MKQDLTQYSDRELCLQVFNDEWLYSIRHETGLLEILAKFFIFNAKQLQELENDLKEDLEEIRSKSL